MWPFLRRRLLASLLTLFGITTITFALARVVPSDPAAVYIGPLARPDEIARVTKELGSTGPSTSSTGRTCGTWPMVTGAVLGDQGAGPRWYRRPAAGDARADLPRDDARRPDRGAARDLRRLPQGRTSRHGRARRLGGGDLDAGLLARAAAAGPSSRRRCMCSLPDRAAQPGDVGSRADPAHHWLLSPGLARDRRLGRRTGRGQPSRAAHDHARCLPGCVDHEDDEGFDARRPRAGLHPHRPGPSAWASGSCSGASPSGTRCRRR